MVSAGETPEKPNGRIASGGSHTASKGNMIATATSDRSKILIVDDEFGPRESLRFLLKEEYDVVCADSVDTGMALLKRESPDLVIMDIRMPGKTGIQGLRELRAVDPHTSVVMLTGYGALETAQEALRLGANDYINKPFDAQELRGIVGRFTNRSRVERKRQRMLRELQDMNSRLVEDIASKDHLASLGQTSAEFAHDLRNPLMIVMGYVGLLTQELERVREMVGNEDGKVGEYLTIIETNIRRCIDLAEMWQNMDKAELGEFSRLPVAQIINDVMASVEPLTSVADVEIEYQVEPGDAEVVGSRAQLLRAIHNIIANAIDAVDENAGKIVLSCEVRGRCVDIQVRDNGPGMPADVLRRMFEPYFTTKPKGKGTGLGTVIARRIIEEHRGMIDADSASGKGTTVRITLPLAPKGAAPDSRAKA
jgi:signal transduction histidine kinase